MHWCYLLNSINGHRRNIPTSLVLVRALFTTTRCSWNSRHLRRPSGRYPWGLLIFTLFKVSCSKVKVEGRGMCYCCGYLFISSFDRDSPLRHLVKMHTDEMRFGFSPWLICFPCWLVTPVLFCIIKPCRQKHPLPLIGVSLYSYLNPN